MKKIYLLFSSIIAVVFSNAQPTLTAANTNPIAGDSFMKKTFNPVTGQEGSAGANQTWDWSNVVEDLSITGEFISPAGTVHALENPAATVCLSSNGILEYELGNNSGYYLLAYYDSSNDMSQVYTIPEKVMSFPFSLNSTYTTTYHADIDYGFLTGTRSGTITVTADAWGTLITPSVTYTNVLRVHTNIDEFFDYGTVASYQNTIDQYSYYVPNIHYPVGVVTWYVTDGLDFSDASWLSSTVGIKEVSASLYKLNVYPNPAHDLTTFTYTLTELSSVSISVIDQTGRIVQQSGEEMIQPGRHTFEVDAANLSNGIYFIQAIINEETASIKMMVNH